MENVLGRRIYRETSSQILGSGAFFPFQKEQTAMNASSSLPSPPARYFICKLERRLNLESAMTIDAFNTYQIERNVTSEERLWAFCFRHLGEVPRGQISIVPNRRTVSCAKKLPRTLAIKGIRNYRTACKRQAPAARRSELDHSKFS